MLDQAEFEQLREVRRREEMALKPSPYLKDKYVNDFGEEAEVVVRNYQKIGIMNLLMVPWTLLGDDTGLGKTLEVLSAIGYVWLKEPEYVPVIITTKSALFQWEAETKRFMQDMECVTVCGEPFRRHAAYNEFFLNHDPSKRRLLILTYDNVMYDAEESVIREQAKKAKDLRKGFNKELASAKADKKAADALLEAQKAIVQDRYAGSLLEVQEFVRECSKKGAVEGPFPAGWATEDTVVVERCLEVRADQKEKEARLEALKEELAPSRKVPGIPEYMNWLKEAHPNVKFMLVMDEMHKLKNHKSQFHLKVQGMSLLSERLVGMTATPVKNRLMEFWSLFRILRPDLFPKITHFQNEFCVMKMQKISRNRQVPVVVGYRNLDEFVRRIEPFYLSRKKHEVAKELPELISMEVDCELSEVQDGLYDMAEAGLLDELDEDEDSSADTLRAITACLQAVDAPQLLLDEDGEPFQGESSKLEALVDLLNGNADGKKVIVYSKFEKMISLIEERLVKEKVVCGRITGKETDPKKRRKTAESFQDPKSGLDVILITSAGSESINLHAAEHFVFFDLPWSYGDYLQLVGRMIRIGSSHETVVAHHFLGRRTSGKQTIDHHILKALKAKKKLADKVAGENLQGALEFQEGDATLDALAMLQQEAKGTKRNEKRLPPKPGAKERAPQAPEKPPEPEEKHYMGAIDFSDV
jgi:SNF2 family DNA or RNA helicase